MNTISGSSTYSTSRSTNKGMSGLVSGLDTEGMVEGMLSGVQGEIDKATGSKQQLTWKQEIYRDIISQLNAFQSKYFDYTTPETNLLSYAFYNAMMATSKSTAISVTAGSQAATGKTSIQVAQLATNASMTSAKPVSGALVGEITADSWDALASREVTFDVGGKAVKIDLTGVTSDAEIAERLSYEHNADGTAKLDADGKKISTGMTAALDSKGKMCITSKEKLSVTSGSSGALAILGLNEGSKGIYGTQGHGNEYALTSVTDAKATPTIEVTLDGIAKKIKIDLSQTAKPSTVDGQADAIRAALREGLTAHGGERQIQVGGSGTSITMNTDAGRQVVVGGGKAVMGALGMVEGASNKIAVGSKLRDLNFAGTSLQGSGFRFSINGTDFAFTGDDTVGSMMSKINASDAGVRISYNDLEDVFKIESSTTGSGYDIKMEQNEGNLLTAIFGVQTGKSVSGRVTIDHLNADATVSGLVKDDSFTGGTGMSMTVNGKSYYFKLPAQDKDGTVRTYTRSSAVSELNRQFSEAFGTTADGKSNLEIDTNGDLQVRNGATVEFSKTTGNILDKDGNVDAGLVNALAKSDLGFALGFRSKITNNVATGNRTLAEVGLAGIKGKDGTILADTTKLSDLGTLTANQLVFDETRGRVVLIGSGAAVSAEGTVRGENMMESLFGSATVGLGVDADPAQQAQRITGKNAQVIINGVQTERSSNVFTVNGLNVTLNETTGTYDSYKQIPKAYALADGTVQTLGTGETTETLSDGTVNLVKADGTKVGILTDKVYINGKGEACILHKGQSLDAEGYLCEGGKRVFTGETADVNVDRNTDQIYDGIKGFVDDYNKILKTLNGYTDADATYKEYAPLTDAQKKEMSEKEIEKWEEKSKTGLLRNDSDVGAFLQAMRSMIYEKPAGSQYAIYDVGIETSGNWRDKGQLILTDGGADLKAMIKANPKGIQELFLGADGLAQKLKDTIAGAANTSTGSPGSLVSLAGAKGFGTEKNNTLSDRIKDINERIKSLQSKYTTQKNRYWRQFNEMERVMSQMNTQSSWLMQQLG